MRSSSIPSPTSPLTTQQSSLALNNALGWLRNRLAVRILLWLLPLLDQRRAGFNGFVAQVDTDQRRTRCAEQFGQIVEQAGVESSRIAISP